MNILHISTSLENGGAEALLVSVVTNDTEDNQHQVVSLFTEGFNGPILKEIGIPVLALNMPRSRLNVSAVLALYKHIREVKPDVVQCWMYHANFLGGLVARLAGVKNVYWGLHNADMDTAGTSRSMHMCNKACALMSSFSPKAVVHSSEVGAAIHIRQGYSKKNMEVIPGGYDLSKYKPQPQQRVTFRSELGLTDSIPVIGMIARFDPQKDHENLIFAIKRLQEKIESDFRVLLIGPSMNNDNKELMSLINTANISSKVILLGPRRDIPSLANVLDIHVLSSAFGESFPNVVNETMATGVPNLVTDVGDSKLIVGDTGWVVQPKKPDDFAAALEYAITELQESPAKWKLRKESCRNRVLENFSIAACIDRYHTLWG